MSKETFKILLSLPRHALGFVLILISYVFARITTWVGFAGAYLMDNEQYWHQHEALAKAKIKEASEEIKPKKP